MFINTVTLVGATAEGACFRADWPIPEAVLANQTRSAQTCCCPIPSGPGAFGTGRCRRKGT
ncbi:MAG: hypothetical protein WCS96_11215, partial [Victivallales bacterium]